MKTDEMGCFTGDCPHEKSFECIEAIEKWVKIVAAEKDAKIRKWCNMYGNATEKLEVKDTLIAESRAFINTTMHHSSVCDSLHEPNDDCSCAKGVILEKLKVTK